MDEDDLDGLHVFLLVGAAALVGLFFCEAAPMIMDLL